MHFICTALKNIVMYFLCFQGETKGKESTLDELLKLNPTLQMSKPAAPPQPKTLQNSTAANRLSMAAPTHTMQMEEEEDTFLLDHINIKNQKSQH